MNFISRRVWYLEPLLWGFDQWQRAAPILALLFNRRDHPAASRPDEVQEADYPLEYSQLKPDLPLIEALRLFRAACNHRHTLFVTDRWFDMYRIYLHWGLHRRITADEAEALKATVRQEVSMAYLCVWLWRPFRPRWAKHVDRLKAHRAKARENAEAIPKTPGAAIFPWAHVEACRLHAGQTLPTGKQAPTALYKVQPSLPKEHYLPNAKPCPRCNAAASELEWVYFVSPKVTWEWMCGRAGWVTVCQKCTIQVQFFLEMMN